MKKVILILLSLISLKLNAQDSTATDKYKNSIQISLGSLGLYAFSYEKNVLDKKQDISVELGYSYTSNMDFKMEHNFLLSGNYIIGTKSSRLEMGPTINLFTNDEYDNALKYPNIYNDHTASRFRMFYGARVGYRLQIPNKRFLLKVHYIAAFELRDESSGVGHMGGVTFGYRFK